MSREEAHKLLGGYATGTLTAEEQEALFAAALEDQDLFDALAREQSLREVLVDPASRAQLLAAIDERPLPWYRRWVPIAAVATGLATIAIVGVWQQTRPALPVKMAKLDFPARTTAPSSLPVLPPPPEVGSPSPSVQRSLPANIVPVAPMPPRKRDAIVAAADKVTIPLAAPRVVTPPAGQGFAPQAMFSGVLPSPVPVRGTVTDSAGAAIATATVEVKSLATGAVDKISTDEKGQFNTAEIPGRNYEIQAYAPGYQPMILNTVPVNGEPGPLNLKLEADKMKDSVKVASADAERRSSPVSRLSSPVKDEPVVAGTAGARGGAAAGGRGGRGGSGGGLADAPALQKQVGQQSAAQAGGQQGQTDVQEAKAKAPPATFGSLGGVAGASLRPAATSVEYKLMRRMPDGTLAETVGANFPVGEPLIVRVTAPSDGLLSIGRPGVAPALRQQIHGQQPFDATMPRFDRKGSVELELVFTPETGAAEKPSFSTNGLPNRTQLTIKINVQ